MFIILFLQIKIVYIQINNLNNKVVNVFIIRLTKKLRYGRPYERIKIIFKQFDVFLCFL